MLTAENYFSPENNLKYMGSTDFKRFMSCESRALAAFRGEWVEEESTAMLVGSYVDAHFSGTLDIFRAQHPDIFTRSGSLKSDFEQANNIIARIERDPMMMKYLSGQPQVIMTGEIAGVPFKIKIDSYHPGRLIVDQKVMKDFNTVWKDGQGRVPFVEAWGYDYQACLYQEIERQNRGADAKPLPFVIAGATKEKPEPDIDLIGIPQDHLDGCLATVEALAPRYQEIKQGLVEPERCGRSTCDYCKSTKELSGVIDYKEVG
jgi:hypothetical protein